jgi:hypothetical protein
VYDYLLKRQCAEAAQAFAKEAGLDLHQLHIPVSTPQGFLYEWWTVFWDIYSAKNPGSSSNAHSSGPLSNAPNGQTSKQLMAYLAMQTAMDQKNASEYKSRKMAEFRFVQQQQSMMNGFPSSSSSSTSSNAQQQQQQQQQQQSQQNNGQKRQMMEPPAHGKLGLIAEMEAAQNSPLIGASPALQSGLINYHYQRKAYTND